MRIMNFRERVYQVVGKIRSGKVLSYKFQL